MSATMVTSFSRRRLTLFTKIGWGHDYLRDMNFAATLTGVPGLDPLRATIDAPQCNAVIVHDAGHRR